MMTGNTIFPKLQRRFTPSTNPYFFKGTPSTAEERAALQQHGFVHITGLRTYNIQTREVEYVVGEDTLTCRPGTWGENNNKVAIITTGGEVWIRAGQMTDTIQTLRNRLCPNGGEAFVPLSNVETASAEDILRRVADPNYELAVRAH